LSVLLHHQGEDAEIVVPIVIVPVVAVQAVLVEVAKAETVAVRVDLRRAPSGPLPIEYSPGCI